MSGKFKFRMKSYPGAYNISAKEAVTMLDSFKLGAIVFITSLEGGNPLGLLLYSIYEVVESGGEKNYELKDSTKWVSYLDDNGYYEKPENRQFFEDKYPSFRLGSGTSSYKNIKHAKYIEDYHSPFNYLEGDDPNNYYHQSNGYNPGLAYSGRAPIIALRKQLDFDISQKYIVIKTECTTFSTYNAVYADYYDYNNNFLYSTYLSSAGKTFILVLQGPGSPGEGGGKYHGGKGGANGGAVVLLLSTANLLDYQDSSGKGFHNLIRFKKLTNIPSGVNPQIAPSIFSSQIDYYNEATGSWVNSVILLAKGTYSSGVNQNRIKDAEGKVLGTNDFGAFKLCNQCVVNAVTGSYSGNINAVPSVGGLYSLGLWGMIVTSSGTDGFKVTSGNSDGNSVIHFKSDGADGSGSSSWTGTSYYGGAGGKGSILASGGAGGNGYSSIDGGNGKAGGVGAGGGAGGAGGNGTGGDGGLGGNAGLAIYY